ncbi:MAG: hypothetical protein ABI268_10015 [Rhodanobacter sp.]
MRRAVSAVKKSWDQKRELIGRFAFELVVVFIGVTAAFALENWRENASEAKYHASMIAALRPTLDDVVRHNTDFDAEVVPKLAAFDAAVAAGGEPALPIFGEINSERPPTRAWDGLVAAGAAKALEPALFFELALFYTRQESFGERYIRYNKFTEQHVYPLGNRPSVFYDPVTRQLKPEFAAYVDRLRDLEHFNVSITRQAVKLRDELGRTK